VPENSSLQQYLCGEKYRQLGYGLSRRPGASLRLCYLSILQGAQQKRTALRAPLGHEEVFAMPLKLLASECAIRGSNVSI
jgi:hypothetical protein